MTDIRVTRGAIEVLSNLTTTPVVRVTRQAIEVLTSNDDVPVVSATVPIVISINYLYVE